MQARELPPQMFADAELADVFFANADRGWAVGDRGVVWSTFDSGRTWERQNSGVSCRLESIWFIDEDRGWAVGGRTHPYTHRSSGVLLQTSDGGNKWQQVKTSALPRLLQVKFFDAAKGCALAESSAMYPSGVLRTDDGGRSWTGAATNRKQHWRTGDFQDSRNAVVVGNNHWARLDGSVLRSIQHPPLGLARPNCVRFGSGKTGWLVGDRGMVMQTVGGRTWQANRSLPDGTTRYFDFQALEIYKNHCWIAGTPGTVVFHSADSGKSWEAFATDQNLPVQAMTFLDAKRGWAVGALGMILATRDGGRTWRQQRSGGERAALLAVVGDADAIPFELLARESANQGFLTAVEVVGRRDVEARDDRSETIFRRTHDAAVVAGASTASTSWRFPLRQAGLHLSAQHILEGWDASNNGHGTTNLEEHIVSKIRQWQPDVIVTDSPSLDGSEPLGLLVSQAVLKCVELANDPSAFPQQMQSTQLKPWKVKRVFCPTFQDEQATAQIVTTAFAPQLGHSIADVAQDAGSRISATPRDVPVTAGYRMLVDNVRTRARGGLFSGLAIPLGSETRRAQGPTLGTSIDRVQRIAQKHRAIEHFLAHQGGGTNWIADVQSLTNGLGYEISGSVVYHLATHYRDIGQWEQAAQAMEYLLQRYHRHELSEAAIVWLVQYYTSGELDQHLSRKSGKEGQFDATVANYDPQNSGAASTKISALAQWIPRSNAALFAEPIVQFPLESANRRRGSASDALRFYKSQAQRLTADPWSSCARAEVWLDRPKGASPKRVIRCLRAKQKPYLDGKFDEKIWRETTPVSLNSATQDDSQWPCFVMIAYDQDMLYLAAKCDKAKDETYPASHATRPRDPDLSRHDRIDWLIDLDRDYSTYFRLTIDHRGWAGEACVGDVKWNPQWFVAAHSDETTWSVEAAIPLGQLTTETLKAGSVWAIGVQRTLPRVGFQSASRPAAIKVRPDGFGLLVFE